MEPETQTLIVRVALGVAGLVFLAVLGIAVYVARRAAKTRAWILSLFRKPPRPHPPGKDHYYKPYWGAR